MNSQAVEPVETVDSGVSADAGGVDGGAGVRVVREGAELDGPLYVDLDGTLIATDMLYESILDLATQAPGRLLGCLPALASGKAAFKEALAQQVEPDVAALPYRREVLDHVQSARNSGRRCVLATATHERLASRIAEHLGCFDAVLATGPTRNLKGPAKLAAIETDAQGQPFEYMGDTYADVPVWSGAALATVVNGDARVHAAAEAAAPGRVRSLAPGKSRVRAWFKALRPHQWVKNALLFAPVVLAHQLDDAGKLGAVVLAFLCFGLIASGTYVLNDLLDLAADRRHPRKCQRPLASGALPLGAGIVTLPALVGLGFGISLVALSWATTAMLLLYAVATITYSFYLKKQLFLDVLVLAGLYTHRVLTGGVAAEVAVSPWLLAFSMFFFLSLALVKRYIELLAAAERQAEGGSGVIHRRGYSPADTGLVESMGLTSGFVSVLVLCLYVSSDAVIPLYSRPELLWTMVPIMLYWIARIWFLARRGDVPDDPVLFAATDKTSYLAGALLGVAVLMAGPL